MGVAGLAQVAVLGVCLATAAAWDLWKRRIPNSVNVATAVLGLGAALATGSLTVVAHALAGAGVVFGVLLLMYRQRWIGGGDVKLGVAFGTWLGPVGGLSALVVGIAFNGIVAVYLLVRGGSAFRAEVKSNLVMAAYTGRVGETEHRPDSAHIPLGAALAASALVVFIVRGGVGA